MRSVSRIKRLMRTPTCREGAVVLLLVLLVVPGAVGAGGQTRTAAISGVVTDAATKRPLGGVVVSIATGVGPAGQVQQHTTDVRGRFVFDELPASTEYQLVARRSGYLDGRYASPASMMSGTRIALTDGQWFSAADIALVKLGAIGGTVRDEAGEPMIGVFVRALVEITVGGRPQLAAGATSKTDDRGEYRLAGLAAGRYLVVVPSTQNTVPATTTGAEIEGLRQDMFERLEAALAQGRGGRRLNNGALDSRAARLIIGNYAIPPPPMDGRTRAYPITFHPGASSLDTAARVDLAGGDERAAVDVTVHPVTAVTVSGRVDGMTTPVPLTLRLLATGMEGLGSGSEVATTIVSADGTFGFLSVPPGTYTLEARQSVFEFRARPQVGEATTLPRTPGRATLGIQMVDRAPSAFAGASYSALLDPPGPSYFGRTSLSVGSTDISNAALTLHPTVAVHGRFVFEDMATGTPRRPPVVLAVPSDGKWELGLAASAESGPDGHVFTIAGLAAGSWLLQPTPPPGVVVKSIVADGVDYSRKPLAIGPNDDLGEVTITFTGNGAMLAGTVGGSDRPLDGIAVVAFPSDRTSWPHLGLTPRWAAVTMAASDNSFRFPALPAGEYFVAAMDAARAGEWTDPALLEQLAARATRVSLRWGEATSAGVTVAQVRR